MHSLEANDLLSLLECIKSASKKIWISVAFTGVGGSPHAVSSSRIRVISAVGSRVTASLLYGVPSEYFVVEERII